MGYTLLKLTSQGICLRDYHLRRLEVTGGRSARDLERFSRQASCGVWALTMDDTSGLRVERRPGSRLDDGITVRYAQSPVGTRRGRFPKPSSPGPYDAVRLNKVATLLTSRGGREIYEACCAAVIGWDGRRVVCIPSDRPRVWSTAEEAIREHIAVCEAPILVHSTAPILLVNAIKGTCSVAVPSRESFPINVRARIDQLFVELTGPCVADIDTAV